MISTIPKLQFTMQKAQITRFGDVVDARQQRARYNEILPEVASKEEREGWCGPLGRRCLSATEAHFSRRGAPAARYPHERI